MGIRLSMWWHRKTDHDWRPSRLIAQVLPRSVLYWAYIRAGVENIQSHEVVPEVTYTEVLQRLPQF